MQVFMQLLLSGKTHKSRFFRFKCAVFNSNALTSEMKLHFSSCFQKTLEEDLMFSKEGRISSWFLTRVGPCFGQTNDIHLHAVDMP